MNNALSFSALIEIIDINPYALLPNQVLEEIFQQAGKNKGSIPVKGLIDGIPFTQTLVKFRGKWRLYLNKPMRKAINKDIGDVANFSITFNPTMPLIQVHPILQQALNEHPKAKTIFDHLSPSLQKEIIRYINQLKTDDSIKRNVENAIQFLLGRKRFIGRDKP